MNRRDFLGMGMGVLASFLYSCSIAKRRPLSKYQALLRQNPSYSEIIDELREREYFAPQDVIVRFFMSAGFPLHFLIQNTSLPPKGLYIKRNVLDIISQDVFRKNMFIEGLKKDEADYFVRLFSRPDTIILNSQLLEGPPEEFREAIVHERMHRYMTIELNDEQRLRMYTAVKEIMGGIPDPENVYWKDRKMRIGEYKSIEENPEEFFTYLSTGSLGKEFEEMLMKYPEEYKIFSRLRDKAAKISN